MGQRRPGHAVLSPGEFRRRLTGVRRDAPPSIGLSERPGARGSVGATNCRMLHRRAVDSVASRRGARSERASEIGGVALFPHRCPFTFSNSVLEPQRARLTMSTRPRSPSSCPFSVPRLPDRDVVSSDAVGLSDVTHSLLEISTDNGGVWALLPSGRILVVRTGFCRSVVLSGGSSGVSRADNFTAQGEVTMHGRDDVLMGGGLMGV